MDVAAAAHVYLHYSTLSHKNRKAKRKKRRWWQIDLYKSKNNVQEEIGGLLTDLKFQAVSGHYKNFTRMTPSNFEFLLYKIGPKIKKQDTAFRRAISIEGRLAVTLRYLATGDSHSSLQFLFKISKQSISSIVVDVCQALVEKLNQNIKVSTQNYICNINTQIKKHLT